MPRSVNFASQTASSRSVLGRPGTFLTSRALTSCTLRPPACSRYTKGRQESEVDSTVTFWIPRPASCPASSLIAPVVAGTSHTLVRRRPGRDGCATRVHTIPDALATSIAATRSQVCSCSSSSISCGSRIAGYASSHPWARSRAARGPRSGTESLTGVLEAQCATRQGQSPSARLNPRAHDPETIPASAGNPTTFSRSRDVPAGTPRLIRKCTVSGQAAAPGAAQWSRVQAASMGWSGGGFEGDPVAEGFQLADVVALDALGVDAGVVEAGAQVLEPGGGVGQQVPDDDQDGAADRHDGLLGAAAFGQAPVAFSQEGVGPAGGHGGLAQHPGQVRVAVAGGGLAFGFAGRLLDPGREPRPGGQMAWGGEAAHVGADLGDDHLRGSPADPGDLIQPVDGRLKRGDLLLDLGLQLGDVGGCLVDAAKHPGQQEGVVVAEVAGEGLFQLAELGAQAGSCQPRQDLGVPLARDERGQHGPARDPEEVGGDHREFDLGVLQQLLHPLLLGGPPANEDGAVAGPGPAAGGSQGAARSWAAASAARRPYRARPRPAGRSWADPAGA